MKEHTSVMSAEVLEQLAPKKGELVVDATFGRGGHTKALKKPGVKVISIDADPATKADIEGNFGDIKNLLKESLPAGGQVNKVLFDLGWNMTQLDSGRGFSFMHDEPLLMSYSPEPRSGFSAAEMLNTWSEKVLADVFFGYAEERYARRIAKAIVERRKVKPFETTVELTEVVRDAVPARARHGRIHPATKVFQALRIAVNDELRVLESGLNGAWVLLAPDGRMAVITFHSIEDRLVKNLFKKFAAEGGRIITKKPLVPTAHEVATNPAARSAKMRVIQKV